MKQLITVREYARITTDPVATSSLDEAQIPPSAFDWLCELNATFSKAGAALVQVGGRRWLKLDNFVGVLETPCGTRLEILPKHFEDGDSKAKNRELLCRMIQSALDLKTRDVGTADLQLFDAPLNEWVMQRFLLTLDHLIKRGLRFDYQRIEEERRFLRGQLDVVKQMRLPPGRQHHVQIRHDVFLPDRPENRLLKLALDRVCKATQDPGNWRLAHELRGLLMEIPASEDIKQDFKRWQADRLMAHYQSIKPWCELILNQQMPLAVAGDWHGISMLFPMEKLFERYVEAWLRHNLPTSARLTAQARSQYLCQHNGSPMFRLEPDLLIENGKTRWVLDTKWKRLDAHDRENKYGVSQADFYQLYAYGQKYLSNQSLGELVLIYPKWRKFDQPLAPFSFDERLKLSVLPFDLEEPVGLFGAGSTTLPILTEQRPSVALAS